MNGIINVYKEPGCTSQSVVSKIRKILGTRSVGHMGTLDPQGEGVLLVGVGKSTRLFDLMLGKDKIYVARFAFGYETDTLDKDGVVIAQTKVIPSQDEISAAVSKLVGKQNQLPPKYSAKNINGMRAYDLARKGVEFELKPSEIEVYSIKITNKVREGVYDFEIHCSSGTYIRSICRDLAYSLNSLATMTAIKRTKAGDFTSTEAKTLEEIAHLGEEAIIPVEKVLDILPRVDFPDTLYKKVSCGVSFEWKAESVSPFAVYCKNEFFGVGKVEDGMFKITTYLKD